MLVVLHHLIITYGAPGDWYYNENDGNGFYMIPFAMFVSTNQAFFMGMFFLISAYFVPRSYNRKGIRVFLKDRLLRLGIPVAIYFFIISPLTIYYLIKIRDGIELSFW